MPFNRMKKVILLILMLSFISADIDGKAFPDQRRIAKGMDVVGNEPLAADGVEVNATNFPDENFRKWVLENVKGASDGVLTADEISSIKTISCSYKSIKSLQGIEFFTALKSLSCSSNQLTTLDVSHNPALVEITCSSNQLTSLNISRNSALVNLYCYENQLKSLDISHNPALKWLYCYSNQLTSLDVSRNSALEQLFCSYNQLVSLDVSQNVALELLSCYDTQLTSLDVSHNPSLKTLSCGKNQLDSLDVSHNPALETLYCDENQLTSLDLSNNGKLKTVQVGSQSTSREVVSLWEGLGFAVSDDFDDSRVSNLALDSKTVAGSVATHEGQKYFVFAASGTQAGDIDGKSLTYNYNSAGNLNELMDVTVALSYTQPTSCSLSIESGSGGATNYNGTIIKNATKSFTVAYGADAMLTFTPDSGYKLGKVSVEGADMTSQVVNNSFTIRKLTASTTVSVTFEAIPPTTYTLSITTSGNGSVTYDGAMTRNQTRSFTVNEGTNATLDITPDNGYRIASVMVNDLDMTASVNNNRYTISNIQANTTISVTFEAIPPTTYTLSITASGNGSVTYDGTMTRNQTRLFTVNEGTNVTLDITPDNGYRIASVMVNDLDVTASVNNNQYTISNIQSNITVSVTFEAIPPTTYTLSISASGNGSVTYDGTMTRNQTRSFTVNEGTNATLAITPDNGYRIASVKVNDVDVTDNVSNNQYTVSNIQTNTTVVVGFEAIPPTTYTLSISASGNGSVTYDGTMTRNQTRSFTVNEGTNATLAITPDTGYRIASVMVNDVDVTASVSNNQYTVSNIQANTTVSVTFETISITSYTLSITASGNGRVTYYNSATIRNQTRSFTVSEGSDAYLSFSPDSGNKLASVMVNDVDVTASVSNNQYTINNIQANTTVTVTFDEEIRSMTVDGVNYTVTSTANRTVNVARGSYGLSLMVLASFTYAGQQWTVTGMDADVLSGSSELAAVIWNPSSKFPVTPTNPNFLLYVTAQQYAPSGLKNVVVNGRASQITLSDLANGNNFYCPQTFTASSISYTHRYGMTTGINECQGWETVSLPFTVQRITHATKGTLTPFSNYRDPQAERPFWLYEFSSGGFSRTGTIRANVPYIICMPNNQKYDDEYNLAGEVTFYSENVNVEATAGAVGVSNGSVTFVPAFCLVEKSANVYALNVENDYHSDTYGKNPGSVFVRNLRSVSPFEAYMTSSSSGAKEMIDILFDETTAIDEASLCTDSSRPVLVCNLAGQVVARTTSAELTSWLRRLPHGIYVVDGRKMVVK